MTTLQDLREGAYVPNMGEVGIEIETECLNEYRVPPLKYWDAKVDGSLRHIGIEYILKKPLNHNSAEYKEAIEEFNGISKKFKFLESTYTSVHVHLNMVDREIIHLANFITLYLIFENTLTRYCGPDRDGNLFCLKTSDAEQSYRTYVDLISAISSGRANGYISRLISSQIKYSALNVAPLRNLGSVEVRTHGGSSDVVEITRWVDMLMCLYNKAQKFKNPVEIVNLFRDEKKNLSVLNLIFGDLSKYFDVGYLDKDLKSTLYYAAAVASSVKDWDKFSKIEIEKPKFTTKMMIFDEVSVDNLENRDHWDNPGDREWLAGRLEHYRIARAMNVIEPTGDL